MNHARALTALAALAAALVLAACGSDDEGGSTTSSVGAGSEGTGQLMEDTIPAGIVDQPQGFASSDVLRPIENAWRTSSAESFTEVDAGALANDQSTGAFAIFRYDFAAVTQDVNLVEVPDAGPVHITKAPLGEGVEESAQESGRIDFEGDKGVSGTLDLSDDSVSLAK